MKKSEQRRLNACRKEIKRLEAELPSSTGDAREAIIARLCTLDMRMLIWRAYSKVGFVPRAGS